MRRMVLCGLLACAIAVPAEATTITANDAASHVGGMGTVCGTVASVYRTRRDTTFLGFGAGYPEETFTAVTFATAMAGFVGLRRLGGQKVCVTGRIDLYRGHPEIILREPSQLRAAQ